MQKTNPIILFRLKEVYESSENKNIKFSQNSITLPFAPIIIKRGTFELI